jgi:hypothetical protein
MMMTTENPSTMNQEDSHHGRSGGERHHARYFVPGRSFFFYPGESSWFMPFGGSSEFRGNIRAGKEQLVPDSAGEGMVHFASPLWRARTMVRQDLAAGGDINWFSDMWFEVNRP